MVFMYSLTLVVVIIIAASIRSNLTVDGNGLGLDGFWVCLYQTVDFVHGISLFLTKFIGSTSRIDQI